jgi:hypothetical protein
MVSYLYNIMISERLCMKMVLQVHEKEVKLSLLTGHGGP